MTRHYTDAELWDILNRQGKAEGPRPKDKPARKKMSFEESHIQRTVIRWWQVKCREFGVAEVLLFSIPNGGHRHVITASIMKAEGARAGAPDLFLACPNHRHSGLFLEIKRLTGVVTPEQEVFHALLRARGYQVNVCRSVKEAVDTIILYLAQ